MWANKNRKLQLKQIDEFLDDELLKLSIIIQLLGQIAG